MADEFKKSPRLSAEGPPDLLEIAQVAAKSKADHDKIIADAIAAEMAEEPKIVQGNYGPFSDNPSRFVVVHEALGPHRNGDVVSYRELCQYNDFEHRSLNVRATKTRVEQLIDMGAIRPATLGE